MFYFTNKLNLLTFFAALNLMQFVIVLHKVKKFALQNAWSFLYMINSCYDEFNDNVIVASFSS